MKIGIANDHGGVEVKKELTKFLTEKGYEVINFGTETLEKVDAIDYSVKLCKSYLNKEIDTGILICTTGIAMSITANKIQGIACAKVDNVHEARQSKEHNNANIIAISALKPIDLLKEIIEAYLNSSFNTDERYQRRYNKLIDLEKRLYK